MKIFGTPGKRNITKKEKNVFVIVTLVILSPLMALVQLDADKTMPIRHNSSALYYFLYEFPASVSVSV